MDNEKFGDVLLKSGEVIALDKAKEDGILKEDVQGFYLTDGQFLCPEVPFCMLNLSEIYKWCKSHDCSVANVKILYFVYFNWSRVNNLLKIFGFKELPLVKYQSSQGYSKNEYFVFHYLVDMATGMLSDEMVCDANGKLYSNYVLGVYRP